MDPNGIRLRAAGPHCSQTYGLLELEAVWSVKKYNLAETIQAF